MPPRLLFLLLTLSPVVTTAAERLDVRGIIEAHAFYNDSDNSWLDGGFSKLRYDQDSTPVALGKAGLNIDLRVTDTLWFRSMAAMYLDNDIDAEFIEAYLQYRPVPAGPLRWRARLGAFHLPGSLENRGIAWSSLYSTTPSVINAWIGEDIRVVGSEVTLSWPGRFRGSLHDFSITAAVFGFNDGIGTVLAYRGWASHDRQTGFGTALRLPSFAGGVKREYEPIVEIDDRPGYYIHAGWGYAGKLELGFMHYDNRADAAANRDRQNAWRTRFEHVTLQWDVTENLRLLGQYMTGYTEADIRVIGFYSDVDFASGYLMLVWRQDPHRVSLRGELFETEDQDIFTTPDHNSDETGHAIMLSYAYNFNTNWEIGAEWMHVRSKRVDRLDRIGFGTESENQLLFTATYRF